MLGQVHYQFFIVPFLHIDTKLKTPGHNFYSIKMKSGDHGLNPKS